MGGCGILARLVPEPAAPAQVLAAAHDVPDDALAAEEGLVVCRCRGRCRGWRALETCVYQRPAAAHPVAVAAVDELVRAK